MKIVIFLLKYISKNIIYLKKSNVLTHFVFQNGRPKMPVFGDIENAHIWGGGDTHN